MRIAEKEDRASSVNPLHLIPLSPFMFTMNVASRRTGLGRQHNCRFGPPCSLGNSHGPFHMSAHANVLRSCI